MHVANGMYGLILVEPTGGLPKVFNGVVGAMAGNNAAQAKVGERVRLFVGNGGPNFTSSFHVIGEIFDNVYLEGACGPRNIKSR